MPKIRHLLFLVCALPVLAAPRIKVIKLAVTNPGDQALAAAHAVVPIQELAWVGPNLKGAVIVTTGDAAIWKLAALNIVRSKPASHAAVLQVSVEAVCEFLVASRAADEPGIELNWLSNGRREVGDEVIWDSCSSKETSCTLPPDR